jgi:3-hydroxybutyryl-CoA dehydrogenase
MERVFVVGAGFMGAGIAQVAAQAGYAVGLWDERADALSGAMAEIGRSLGRLAAKGRLAEPVDAVLARIQPAAGLGDAANADWVIEAVFEDPGLKKKLFQTLETVIPDTAILASNTSSIPITRLATACRRPERVVGLHFFGPVPLMGVVEVVKAAETSQDVFEKASEFVRSLGKAPLRVTRDIPMFVLNRVFTAAFNEACDLVADGVATPEDVDMGLKLGFGWNAGPFEIADNAGLDTLVRIMSFTGSLSEDRLKPGPGADLIRSMVQEGRLGRKSGRGFYRYENGKKTT